MIKDKIEGIWLDEVADPFSIEAYKKIENLLTLLGNVITWSTPQKAEGEDAA